MNVASLELCKELYEISGWDDTGDGYVPEYEPDEPPVIFIPENKFAYTHNGQDHYYVTKESDLYQVVYIPAYDLGYLLRKLPHHDEDFTYWMDLGPIENGHWGVSYDCEDMDKYISFGDTPEDATCKLAIELFKQGILTPELSSKEKEHIA